MGYGNTSTRTLPVLWEKPGSQGEVYHFVSGPSAWAGDEELRQLQLLDIAAAGLSAHKLRPQDGGHASLQRTLPALMKSLFRMMTSRCFTHELITFMLSIKALRTME